MDHTYKLIQAAIALLHYYNTSEIAPAQTDRATRDLFDTLVTAGHAVNPKHVGWYGGPVLKGHPLLRKLCAQIARRRNEVQKDAEGYAKRATELSKEATDLNALLLELSEYTSTDTDK